MALHITPPAAPPTASTNEKFPLAQPGWQLSGHLPTECPELFVYSIYTLICSPLAAFAEENAAEPDNRRTQLDGDLEIIRHPHR